MTSLTDSSFPPLKSETFRSITSFIFTRQVLQRNYVDSNVEQCLLRCVTHIHALKQGCTTQVSWRDSVEQCPRCVTHIHALKQGCTTLKSHGGPNIFKEHLRAGNLYDIPHLKDVLTKETR